MVASSITARERICNELQEVGEVHSTGESGDSTTSDKERNLTLCMPVGMAGVFYSSARRYED